MLSVAPPAPGWVSLAVATYARYFPVMASRTPRSRAAQAAAALLTERVRYVEDLDQAVTAQRAAEAAVETAQRAAEAAADEARSAYVAARSGGWTDAELAQLGYRDARPARVAARRRTDSAPSGKAPNSAAKDVASSAAAPSRDGAGSSAPVGADPSPRASHDSVPLHAAAADAPRPAPLD